MEFWLMLWPLPLKKWMSLTFDGSKEEWLQYVERLDFFFQANEIVDDEKKREDVFICGGHCNI